MVFWYIYTTDYLDTITMIKKDRTVRQIHIRLPSETYRKLKLKCVTEDISVQEYVAQMIDISLNHEAAQGDDGDKTGRGRP